MLVPTCHHNSKSNPPPIPIHIHPPLFKQIMKNRLFLSLFAVALISASIWVFSPLSPSPLTLWLLLLGFPCRLWLLSHQQHHQCQKTASQQQRSRPAQPRQWRSRVTILYALPYLTITAVDAFATLATLPSAARTMPANNYYKPTAMTPTITTSAPITIANYNSICNVSLCH